MQGPTHLAAGVLIQKATRTVHPLALQRSLVTFLGILSHGILDKLARLTYHPPEPIVGDRFWISYHLMVYLLSIVMFVKHRKRYKLGLISSVIPDLDWVVLHSSKLLSLQIPCWNKPVLHELLYSLIDQLPLISFLKSLPNWNSERKGVIVECAVLAALVALIYAIRGEEEPGGQL